MDHLLSKEEKEYLEVSGLEVLFSFERFMIFR